MYKLSDGSIVNVCPVPECPGMYALHTLLYPPKRNIRIRLPTIQPRRPAADNTCVCCGDTIPEGRMVCPNCEAAAHKK